jgi:Uma2 family endonuclease
MPTLQTKARRTRPAATDALAEPIYPLSVAQYHAMIAKGIIQEDAPVELLEGRLVKKMAKKAHHTYGTVGLSETLGPLLPSGWHLRSQEPLTTSTSEPEPDGAVVEGDRGRYRERHPRPDETALVAEVSEGTLKRDRGLKKRIYARARIPVYWIVNVQDRQVEVYTKPSGPSKRPDYAKRQDYGVSDEVPVIIGGQEVGHVRVRDLLP